MPLRRCSPLEIVALLSKFTFNPSAPELGLSLANLAVHSCRPSPSFTRQSFTSCIGSRPTMRGPVCNSQLGASAQGKERQRLSGIKHALSYMQAEKQGPGPTQARGPTRECHDPPSPFRRRSGDFQNSRDLPLERQAPCSHCLSHQAPLQSLRVGFYPRLPRRLPPQRRRGCGHQERAGMKNSGGDHGSAASAEIVNL
jgi:hypothetical protein